VIKSIINDEDNGGQARQTECYVEAWLSLLRPWEFIAIEAIDEVIIERLIVEEIVADV
jgi:hypothetical protein